jgi:hypothetical protein
VLIPRGAGRKRAGVSQDVAVMRRRRRDSASKGNGPSWGELRPPFPSDALGRSASGSPSPSAPTGIGSNRTALAFTDFLHLARFVLYKAATGGLPFPDLTQRHQASFSLAALCTFSTGRRAPSVFDRSCPNLKL